jgi:ribonuclease Z
LTPAITNDTNNANIVPAIKRETETGMKRILAGLIVLTLVVGAGLYLVRGQLAVKLVESRVAEGMARDLTSRLPDGLHVVVCGSGGPFPDGDRGAPCTAVIAGKRLFIVDTGEAAARTLGRLGVGGDSVVLLTHFHSDHIDGLGNVALMRWGGSNLTTPLSLYGGPGVERIAAGFNEAYAFDSSYRTAHHGADVMPPSGAGITPKPVIIPAGADSVVVLEEDGVKITAFRVDHGPVEPALGYRFDYKGRSVVISGDTSVSPVVAAQAKGVDLLVHEALSPELVKVLQDGAIRAGRPKRAKIMADIPNYHTSPIEAARIAQSSGAKALLLTHIVPPLPLRALEGPFLGKARDAYDGPLWIARDGDLLSMPAGGGAVSRKRLR